MGKQKSMFFCTECGFESPKWTGQCPGCKSWNVMVEEKVSSKTTTGSSSRMKSLSAVKKLSEISTEADKRIRTGIGELDRVLGGGIVDGSLVLVGGDPGIGKSTLLLQMCRNLTAQNKKILYISGEESLKQIKMRAERLKITSDHLLLLCETNMDVIDACIQREKPHAIIIDSIQTMYSEEIGSASGSVSQVREATGTLMRLAKQMDIAIFIVGHVTKEGAIAGPRILEHMVDTVLYFEGDRNAVYRILRAVKNRFGSTNEIGVFEMRENGLSEVTNPSEYMLSGRPVLAAGSAITCCMEGTRPMLIEVQALVCRTSFGMPRRTAAGTDYNRVNLLMAVLEKKVGLVMSDCDAYVNVAGGMKITEPSMDLSIVMSIVSSLKNKPINDKMIVVGEVGLTGEVRAISMAEQRLSEVYKMGFTICVLPKINADNVKIPDGLQVIGVSGVREAISLLDM